MISDLAVAGWLKRMSDDPTQDPQVALAASQTYWKDPAQAATVKALVQHQGSLKYSDPNTLAFEFLVALAASGAMPKPVAVTSSPAPSASLSSAAPQPTKAAVLPQPTKAASPPKSTQPAAIGGLAAIGDGGQPVDWWFIYKVGTGKPSDPSLKVAVGDDTPIRFGDGAQPDVAADAVRPPYPRRAKRALRGDGADLRAGGESEPGAWLVLLQRRRSAGVATPTRPAGGQGPPWDCGHCKGVLAFDLASNTAFWLIHSVPLFPWPPNWQYRDGELEMGRACCASRYRMPKQRRPSPN